MQLLTGKNESLLIRGDSLFILNLGFHVLDGVGRLNLQSDGFASQSLDEDLHSSSKSQDKMKSRLFLYVVIAESSAIL